MSASARVTLAQVVREGAIEAASSDPDVAHHLLEQARNYLRTPQTRLDGGDDEGAFQLAYDASCRHCLALVPAAGHWPHDGKEYHGVTFAANTALAESFCERKLVHEASDLRYVRNNAEHRGETIASDDVVDTIEIGVHSQESAARSHSS